MPLADVVDLGCPTVLITLGAAVVIAAALRRLDDRLPFGSPAPSGVEAPEAPRPRAGGEAVAKREGGAGR
ncbi:hypothetical protein [Actinoplanes sp. OR16]|uniref:hypothetical protein n=1 Tax=Actinoplanes sp. OR16 TaxID=946334 RepID=UPI000FDB74A2|nr:hypothetical protein [Actinoplanes sp. OR16]